MLIRKATMADVEACDAIYSAARGYMRESGNSGQWSGIYPCGDDVIIGINAGTSYVCEDGGEVVATFHFSVGDDPTYRVIYGGEWKNPLPYGVIHRIAVKYHGKGIADFCYKECFALCGNLKIDTHEKNLPMQRSLAKNGFEYCGIIHLANGDERMAYQKTR